MEPKPTDLDEARRAARRRWLWYAVLAAAYLAAACPLAYFARDAINPDGVAYVQTARHWAAGRVDLAVNGWFSPLLSWLLVPAVWLGLEPFAAARVLGVLYGLLFAAGAVRLTAAMGGRRFSLWAFGAALLLSLRTVFAEVTPDFLMTAGLTWFYALVAEMIAAPDSRRGMVKAVLAGLVGGACYLAKAYALPVVLVTLALAAGFRVLRPRQEAMPSRASGIRSAIPFAWATGVSVLVCVPWIVAISAQFGRFTTSTAASLAARSWRFVPGVQAKGSHPHLPAQTLSDGRMTVWENPAEAKGDWAQWQVPGGGSWSWDYQSKTIAFNLEDLGKHLNKSDAMMTLAIGWAAALVMACASGRLGPRRRLWLWACLAAVVYLGGYALLYFYERFTWGVWGVLIALCAGVLASLSAPAAVPQAGTRKGKVPPSVPRSTARRAAAVVLAAAALASIGFRVAQRIQDETSNPASESRLGVWIRHASVAFPRQAQGASIVSNDWPKGLYLSYWSGSRFLGQWQEGTYFCQVLDAMRKGRIQTQRLRVDDLGKELRPLAPVTVVSFEEPGHYPLSSLAEGTGGFLLTGTQSDDAASGWRAAFVSFDPNVAPMPIQLPR